MGMAVGHKGDIDAEPNVIPMIDILLVLLIIFMISLPLSR
jgi:biopolymer transport protein ExbD